jgi:hypothetical protein
MPLDTRIGGDGRISGWRRSGKRSAAALLGHPRLYAFSMTALLRGPFSRPLG